MTKRITATIALILTILSLVSAQKEKLSNRRQVPGPIPDGGFLLPSGWKITPVGRQIPVGQLPLGMALSHDGHYLAITNNGYDAQSVTLIDTATEKVVRSIPIAKSWLGICFAPTVHRLYVSGGGDNKVMIYDIDEQATEIGAILVGEPGKEIFPGGLALSPSGDRLYIVNNLNGTVTVADTNTRTILATIPVGDHPYKAAVSADGKLYVSNWGSATIAVIDTRSNKVRKNIPVGDHPNDLLVHSATNRLYVANGNFNTVSVIDTQKEKAIETISVALYPKAPPGSTPNALALTSDGTRLFVANADNNNVAIVSVEPKSSSKVLGFIPVGWYPTALALSKDEKRLFVANGKGNASSPNPQGPQPIKPTTRETQYIAQLFKGTIAVIDQPDANTLKQYTKQTYANTPYRDATKDQAANPGGPTAVPRRVGGPSPIKYVLYIIKENRTYDQVFGDMPEGNGDPNLVLFGEEITPNHHALARQFVLLDNFYVNAEVSADGHDWSTAAYSTDFTQKTWPTTYSKRGREYDYEGAKRISWPSTGYIWDACRRRGVSYRSYGEFISNGKTPNDPGRARVPALEGHFDPYYRSFDVKYSDRDRVKEYLRELRTFEAKGQMPRFQILRLPNDHTAATRPGEWTPRAMVADNDVALGQLVEALSHSRFWKELAIFVLEDDAQNGPDHVDAHRSVALVISPYAKRKAVDSTMYSTTGMLRTMELILGLLPMSQHDAAAPPMFNAFANTPNLEPYTAQPARVSLDERNPPNAPGAKQSMLFDLEEEDAAPDIEFNEILWKAIKGESSEMPPPVRSAFVRPHEE